MNDRIVVEISSAKAKFEGWLARGDKIAVYENHDLGSRDIGRKFFVPATTEEQKTMVVATSRGPDTPSMGPGWRYTLVALEGTLERFDFIVLTPEMVCAPDPKPSKLKRTLARYLENDVYEVKAQNIHASPPWGWQAYGVRKDMTPPDVVTFRSMSSMKAYTEKAHFEVTESGVVDVMRKAYR